MGAFSLPTVVSDAPNKIDVYIIGTDSALWHLSWDGLRWSAWEKLGGVIVDQPAAVSWGPGRVDMFATGTDHAMWDNW